jgi:hypothetical protein
MLEVMHLMDEFNVGSYRSVMTPTLHEDQTELYQICQKKKKVRLKNISK